jgi:choline kinase/ubiquinone/menaquinone biosynthesis C-methylase UbiE
VKAIILAAGEGSRLGDLGKGIPKCLVQIADNTLLEIQINTLHACGIEDISVVRGYQGQQIDIPGIKYFDNPDYKNTGVLHSIFCARKELKGELLILYSDILYEEQVVKRLLKSHHDISVGVMVPWQEAVRQRNQIALEDLEIIHFDAESRIQQIGKMPLDEEKTHGQFIGMIKFSEWGIEIFKRNFDRAQKSYSNNPFGRSESLNKAWLTDLLQEMADLGVPLHSVVIERGWLEIDTPEDYERALTDTKFVRRLVKTKTDWDHRSTLYNGLDWVNRDSLLKTMVETAGEFEGKKVLDLGTGTGKILMALKAKNPDNEYYGVDISSGMMSKIDESYGFHLSLSPIEELKDFKDNDFDLLTARMVFHHANNLDKAMSEVHRVLKPGGMFILCEGNPPDRQTVPFYEGMFRFKEDRITYMSDDLVNLLVNEGFKDITSKTIIMKDMSLNNWLDKSGLPFRNIDIIKKMHFNCDESVQKAYNMKFVDDDILMVWKFSVLSGIK